MAESTIQLGRANESPHDISWPSLRSGTFSFAVFGDRGRNHLAPVDQLYYGTELAAAIETYASAFTFRAGDIYMDFAGPDSTAASRRDATAPYMWEVTGLNEQALIDRYRRLPQYEKNATLTIRDNATPPAPEAPTVTVDPVPDGHEGTTSILRARVSGGRYDRLTYSWAVADVDSPTEGTLEGTLSDAAAVRPVWTRGSLGRARFYRTLTKPAEVRLKVTAHGDGVRARSGESRTASVVPVRTNVVGDRATVPPSSVIQTRAQTIDAGETIQIAADNPSSLGVQYNPQASRWTVRPEGGSENAIGIADNTSLMTTWTAPFPTVETRYYLKWRTATSDGNSASSEVSVYVRPRVGNPAPGFANAPDLVASASTGLLLRSRDGGSVWASRPPRMEGIDIDPRDGYFYGVDGTGILVSTDSGETWEGFSPAPVGRPYDISLDPSDGTLWFTGNAGLFYSKTGGLTWERSTGESGFAFGSIAVHPTNGTLYAGDRNGDNFWYRTTLTGNWVQERDVPSGQDNFQAMAVDPDGGYLYATTSRSSGHLYRLSLSNIGGSWERSTGLATGGSDTTGLAVDTRDSKIWAYSETRSELFRLDDASVPTWTRMPSFVTPVLSPTNSVRGFALNRRNGDLWAVGGFESHSPSQRIFRSRNGSRTWDRVRGPIVGTITDISIDDRNGNVLLATSRELYRSANNGSTWSRFSSEPSVDTGTLSFTGIAVNPVDGSVWVTARLISLSITSLIYRQDPTTMTWATTGITAPTGQTRLESIAIEPGSGIVWVAGSSPASLYRSSDSGRTWDGRAFSLGGSAAPTGIGIGQSLFINLLRWEGHVPDSFSWEGAVPDELWFQGHMVFGRERTAA